MNQFIITLSIIIWMLIGSEVIIKEIDRGKIKDEFIAFLLCFIWPTISLYNFLIYLFRKIKLLL